MITNLGGTGANFVSLVARLYDVVNYLYLNSTHNTRVRRCTCIETEEQQGKEKLARLENYTNMQ